MSGLADRRRNLGPTDSVKFVVRQPPKPEAKAKVKDGIKPVFIRQGVVAHATGSAYLESGDTKIQCSVHGPTQLRTGDKFNAKAQVLVNVHIEPYAGVINEEVSEDLERTIIDFVRASITPAIILSQYPKSAITLSIEILSLNNVGIGRKLAAAVNVAMLALVNAGIALRDMVTAVTVASTDDGQLVTDVDVDQEDDQLVSAFSTGDKDGPIQLVSLMITGEGSMERETIDLLLQKAEPVALELRCLFNGYLIEDYAAKQSSIAD